jgi:hypothetical protein
MLAPKRNAVADAQSVVYGAERDLAIAYNSVFPFDWFDIEYREVSDNAKALAPEKKKLFEVLNAKGHTNPSTVWARIRKYGHDERYPVVNEPKLDENGEPIAVEGEQGESGSSRERSPKLRFIEELSALYKFGMRQDNLASDVAKAHSYITLALSELGVNVNLITK